MALNEKFHDGESLILPVPAYAVSGSPVQVGGIVGVCETTRDASGNATVRLKGVFTLTVTGITAIGTPVYVTTATGALVVASGAGVNLLGHALTVKGAGAGLVDVRIAQFSMSVNTIV
jgi:predicted RecA/RadA family phage recombinase